MGAPEGYVALDLVGFTDKGDYNANTVYMKNDLVHHLNDVWCSLKDNMSGIAPVQGENWKVFVRGANTANSMTAVDTSGLVGEPGRVVIAQELLDVISDAVLNKFVAKTMMSGVQVNSADMVPTSALVYAMQQQITKQNSDMGGVTISFVCEVVDIESLMADSTAKIVFFNLVGPTYTGSKPEGADGTFAYGAGYAIKRYETYVGEVGYSQKWNFVFDSDKTLKWF